MAHLSLAGLSADRKRLLLLDESGAEYTVDIDAALRAAVRGDPGRIGQLEIDMESVLRPRDIQARVRAGASPEEVAQEAQTSVDKIMAYAAPVLAERAHMADRAQRASLRRPTGETGARALGEAITGQLRAANVPADSVVWDSWRREDGRWTVTGSYASAQRTGAAHFVFDPPGNFVVADDDDARWLSGEAPAAEPEDQVAARRRRLTVAADELPLGESLGDDALELVAEDAAAVGDEETPGEPSEPDGAEVADGSDAGALGLEQPAEAFLDRVFADQNPAEATAEIESVGEPLVDGASAVDAPSEEDAQGTADSAEEPGSEDAPSEPPHRREVKKSRGRASVPSWDEIMFGSKSGDNPG